MWPPSQTPSSLSFLRKHLPPHVSISLNFKGPVYGGKKNTWCECHDLLIGPALRCSQCNNKLLISMRDQRAAQPMGWRYGSQLKSTGHSGRSFKGLAFNSWHPHGNSPLSVTPVLGDVASFHRHTCRQNSNVHFLRKKEKQEKKKKRTKPRAFRLLSSLCTLGGRATPKFFHLAMKMPFAC